MSKSLKIGIVQQRIEGWNVKENVNRAKELCKKLQQSSPDIVCFPELLPGSASEMRDVAKKLGSYVIASSLPKMSTGGYKNRATVIAPDGSFCGGYDKQALVEDERNAGLVSGDSIEVFEAAAIRFSILICADLPLLPEASTHATAKKAELIFVPAFAVQSLLPFMETMLIARSMDNGVPIVFVNCAGSIKENNLRYGGGKSRLVVPIPTHKGVKSLTDLYKNSGLSPKDNILFEAGEEEGVYTVELDLAQFGYYRDEILEMRSKAMYRLSRYLTGR